MRLCCQETGLQNRQNYVQNQSKCTSMEVYTSFSCSGALALAITLFINKFTADKCSCHQIDLSLFKRTQGKQAPIQGQSLSCYPYITQAAVADQVYKLVTVKQWLFMSSQFNGHSKKVIENSCTIQSSLAHAIRKRTAFAILKTCRNRKEEITIQHNNPYSNCMCIGKLVS